MQLLSTAFTILALISFVAIIYPFKPFMKRSYAGFIAVLSILAVGVLTPKDNDLSKVAEIGINEGVVADSVASTETEPDETPSPLTENALSTASIPAPCGQGGLELGDVVAVSGEHQIRLDADQASPRVKNEKASRALGRAHYHVIDNSTTVRRVCVQPEWTKIRIVTPSWLTQVTGWVPNNALRVIERTTDGARTFVEADFYWDNDTQRFKDEIISIVNRISRENRNCSVIDPSSVAKSGSRSQPNDPVFYVTCGSGANVFNVWFRPDEAESAQQFIARTPLAKGAAVDACEAAAKAAATHPSTVEFSRIWDLAYIPHVSGRARVVSSFTARNGFNLELKYRIDCLFDGASLMETQIVEDQS